MQAEGAQDEHDDHDQANEVDEFMHGINPARQRAKEPTRWVISSVVANPRESYMKSIILWLLGVPIVVIILLNVTGMLGH